MPRQPLDSGEIRLLTELGFVAAGGADVDRAAEIFRALTHLRPQRAFPYIGWAMAHLNAGQSQEAIGVLESARVAIGAARDPDEMADIETFRGLALQQAGRGAESRRTLEWVAGQAAGDAGRLARRLLGLELVD
jgi:hypothetical protein